MWHNPPTRGVFYCYTININTTHTMTTWVFTNSRTDDEYEYDTEGFDEALNYLAEDLGDDYEPIEWSLTDSY